MAIPVRWARAWSRAGLAGAAALALGSPARAHGARCWIDKGALVVPAAFGSIAGDFLLDLSAPASELHVTRAQSAGFEGGQVKADLALADRRIRGVTVRIADLDERTRRFDTSINGVIGADVLRGWILDLRFAPCRFALTPGPMRGSMAAVRLRLDMTQGRPLVAARVSDGVTVRAGRFAVDTGDWESRIGGARLSRPLPENGGRPPVRLRAVEVGGRLFEQVPANVAEAPDGDGALGLAVWSAWRLRLDLARGVLDLWPDHTK